MGMTETDETNQFTFEAFATHTFYTEINRSLVRQALASLAAHPVNATLTIVDMACGTGAVTRLIYPILCMMPMQPSSATLSILFLTSLQHSSKSPLFLLPVAYLPAIAPSTTAPMFLVPSASTTCGHAVL